MSEQEQLEEFIKRAGFRYGWENLESWARIMARQAVEELNARAQQPAQPVVPAGYKLVPIEPTNDMLLKADSACEHIDFEEAELEKALTFDEIRALWKAMLSAAPAQENPE